VPLQTTGLDKHWIQFDMDNILGPPLRLNIHIQPALPSSGPLDNSAYSQTLPLEQSSRQELQLPEANQQISSSRLASLVLVQDEEAVDIKVDSFVRHRKCTLFKLQLQASMHFPGLQNQHTFQSKATVLLSATFKQDSLALAKHVC